MMNDDGKSDGRVVPGKRSNKASARAGAAEGVEGRRPAKENSEPDGQARTQSRERLNAALERVREVASNGKGERFTALWHHVYDIDRLREAYLATNRKSAPGVDRVTWQQYGENLQERLEDLSDRLRRGAFWPEHVRRVYIPKADGRQRPIGMPTLEDKIVQRATAEVLNSIYEVDFQPLSYGFRPGRSQHQALEALASGITRGKVNYVLDADIRGFFDALDHEWLIRFIEHRIADPRVLSVIQKWLRAGVLEDGKHLDVERGTPQGGSISPLLANIYLHYVFDLWVQQWRRKHVNGDMLVVRYADDFIVGFQHESDATQFLAELRERFQKFGLELHPDKTRLIAFGRYAAERRQERDAGKPETFDFLGFTHICATSKKGAFYIRRVTSRKKLRAKLADLKVKMTKRAQTAHREIGPWLHKVIKGHNLYYGFPTNLPALRRFRDEVVKIWVRSLRRLSQKHRTTWDRMKPMIDRWIPKPQITRRARLAT